MKQPVIRLNITPRTYCRSTQNDRILFCIPKEKRNYGSQKRVEQLERYNDYKAAVHALARQKGLEIPAQGACVKFFMPVPKSWKNWQKEAAHMKLHQQRPDLKNLLTAFEDALYSEDKFIAHYAELGKYWVNFDQGWIEITFKEPAYPVFSLLEAKQSRKSKKMIA